MFQVLVQDVMLIFEQPHSPEESEGESQSWFLCQEFPMMFRQMSDSSFGSDNPTSQDTFFVELLKSTVSLDDLFPSIRDSLNGSYDVIIYSNPNSFHA